MRRRRILLSALVLSSIGLARVEAQVEGGDPPAAETVSTEPASIQNKIPVSALAEAQITTSAEESCTTCGELPELRRSPLLSALRSCAELLTDTRATRQRITQCLKNGAARLKAYDTEADLGQARESLQSFLEKGFGQNDDQELFAQRLTGLITALRTRAAGARARRDSPVALVSEGGVSLGNWQAGVLYVLTEHLKARTASGSVFSTITGASAGAVNGLIAASAGCEAPTSHPADSLFYRIWTQLGVTGRHGVPGLLGSESTTHAIFSTAALNHAMDQATTHMTSAKYRAATCEVQLGLTLTHLDDNQVTLSQSANGQPLVTGPSLREKFALKLSFDGSTPSSQRQGPVLTARNLPVRYLENRPFVPSLELGSRFPLLGESSEVDGIVDFTTLLSAVRASGAFPGAFPPVERLPYRRLLNATTAGPQLHSTFIDGGVFDNTPVGLAIELEQSRQSTSAASMQGLLQDLVPDVPTTFLLVDPNVLAWRLGNSGRVTGSGGEHDGILVKYADFVSRFVGSSRNAALAETADRWPFLRKEDSSGLQPRLIAPRRHLPIAGEQLSAFLAFFERDFRIFDFYVGMADAVIMLHADPWLKPTDASTNATLAGIRSPELDCVLAYHRVAAKYGAKRIHEEQLPAACLSLGLAERTQLGDKLVERENNAIAQLDSKEVDADAEAAITSENFRALLVASHNYKLWTMRESSGEPGAEHYDAGYTTAGEFDAFFAELSRAGFRFVDLSRAVGTSDTHMSSEEARRSVRQLMQQALEQLSCEQPSFGSKAALKLVGRVVADQYELLRPRVTLGVGIATQGIEGVLGLKLLDGFRFDTALRVFRFDEATLSRNFRLWRLDTALALQATGIVTLLPWLDLELGGGAQGALTWAFERGPFAAARFGPRLFAGFTLVQRFYMAFDAEYYAVRWLEASFSPLPVPIAGRWQITAAFGIRFHW